VKSEIWRCCDGRPSPLSQTSFAAAIALGVFEATISSKFRANRFGPSFLLRIVGLDLRQATTERLTQQPALRALAGVSAGPFLPLRPSADVRIEHTTSARLIPAMLSQLRDIAYRIVRRPRLANPQRFEIVAQTEGIAKSKAANRYRRLRRHPEESGAPLLRAPWPQSSMTSTSMRHSRAKKWRKLPSARARASSRDNAAARR
jgi:hypothetical protein